MELKKSFFKEIRQGDEINKKIEFLKSLINQKIQSLSCIDNGFLILEKRKLIESLDYICKEVYFFLNHKLDILSEKNNDYNEILKLKENSKEFLNIKNKIKNLKQENNILKYKIITRYQNEIIKKKDFLLEDNKNKDLKLNGKSLSQILRRK